jgi:hypothetical protein
VLPPTNAFGAHQLTIPTSMALIRITHASARMAGHSNRRPRAETAYALVINIFRGFIASPAPTLITALVFPMVPMVVSALKTLSGLGLITTVYAHPLLRAPYFPMACASDAAVRKTLISRDWLSTDIASASMDTPQQSISQPTTITASVMDTSIEMGHASPVPRSLASAMRQARTVAASAWEGTPGTQAEKNVCAI